MKEIRSQQIKKNKKKSELEMASPNELQNADTTFLHSHD